MLNTVIALWLALKLLTGDRYLARFGLYLEAVLTSQLTTMTAKLAPPTFGTGRGIPFFGLRSLGEGVPRTP